MLFADVQNRKGIGCDALEHTVTFDLLNDGRDKAFTIESHMERFFDPDDDLGDMERLVGGEEYVINYTQLTIGDEVKEAGMGRAHWVDRLIARLREALLTSP
jgi:hypothetical protein